ncbi:hypothetical protein A2863_01630 [Candidatus Woesebacteria bacterium RIFCSPHIGHO2_01_FULL_38_9b]|uniref:Uncharacterized protein n=1 Tax=Candidatus Woesebacteria bacterium RIFCSPHIGHO2_01_FULL_38_9b TaxID=1802493 RepID=A0A1F7Y0J2_9BACT|nr:MAG: hypothetical protein A2863_01630 [Candidatus Woesebacteria bacterium RIFCSPHIGHO2_01_FULL_38_9b]
MRKIIIPSIVVIAFVAFAAITIYFFINSSFLLKNIFVSAEDSFGFIIPANHEVQGPMRRNYDCKKPELGQDCKLFHEYDIRNPNDEHHDYIIFEVYSNVPDNNKKPTITIGTKTIAFLIGDGFKSFDNLKSSISQIKDVNTGNCSCNLCSGSCTKPSSERILCGIPSEENYIFCAENYCIDNGSTCTSVSYNVLKRNYLKSNLFKVLKSIF